MPHSDWIVDTSHSSIVFSVRHMMFAKVRGTFGSWSGTVTVDERDHIAADAHVRIDVAAIDTKDRERDLHLVSADFFDAATHPEIVFRSTKTTPSGGRRQRLAGDLTMRGVTREAIVHVRFLGGATDPAGVERLAYSARTEVDRTRWGLVWNAALEAGGFLVGDTVTLEFDVQLVRRPVA